MRQPPSVVGERADFHQPFPNNEKGVSFIAFSDQILPAWHLQDVRKRFEQFYQSLGSRLRDPKVPKIGICHSSIAHPATL